MDNFDLTREEYLQGVFKICLRQVFQDLEESNALDQVSGEEILRIAKHNYDELLSCGREYDSEISETIYQGA